MDVRAYWRAVLDQDRAAMGGFIHENAVVNWHCSNESFTAEEFIRANCEYPGDWDGVMERLERMGDLIITAVRVFPKDQSASFHCVSFIRVQDERIISIDEYWGDDGPPPAWRLEKKIGRKIHE